jgi:hypothetical protein
MRPLGWLLLSLGGRPGVWWLFQTHLPEQNIDMPAQRGANHIAEPPSSFFQHFVIVESIQLGFVFRMGAAVRPDKVIVLTVNSVFGFGLRERARNSSMRLLKSASYSAAVIGLGLGRLSQART